MTAAGIDIGTTLIKAAWLRDGEELQVASTADRPIEGIVSDMEHHGVTRARVTGIGKHRLPQTRIQTLRPSVDPIDDEIRLQARGARSLAALQQVGPGPDDFLLVSVGTGTSYTSVTGGSVRRHPFGSPVGGGFIAGLTSMIIGLRVETLDRLAEKGRPLDLRVSDLLPETADTLRGMMVVANFGTMHRDASPADQAATLLHLVATLVARDIALLGGDHTTAVVVGTVPKRMPTFTDFLTMYCTALGKKVVTSPLGEYVAAIGAMERAEEQDRKE